MSTRPGLLGHEINRKSSRDQPFNDQVWAITFSDLITLLFCFFLTMVSFGPMGKAYRESQMPETITEEQDKTVTKDGTALAVNGTGVQKRTFEFTGAELAEIARGNETEKLQDIKKIVVSEGYDERRVTVTVSPDIQDEGQSTRWLSIIQRLSGLQRQVFDAQPQTLLKLRISDPFPVTGEIGVQKAGNRERIQALIEIEDVRSHG